MKTILECIDNVFGKIPPEDKTICLSLSDLRLLIDNYAGQFSYIKTIYNEDVIFDLEDYDFLRSISIRKNYCGHLIWTKEKKQILIAQFLINSKKGDVVKYLDGNILNIKKSNIVAVSRKEWLDKIIEDEST